MDDDYTKALAALPSSGFHLNCGHTTGESLEVNLNACFKCYGSRLLLLMASQVYLHVCNRPSALFLGRDVGLGFWWETLKGIA